MYARIWLPLCLAFFAAVAGARVGESYDQQAFDRLNAAGTPIVVAVHADWCTTCKAQEHVLASLAQRPELRTLRIVRVDYDTQKDALKAFHAEERSTLIVFRGGKEVGRLTGEIRTAQIEALLHKAL